MNIYEVRVEMDGYRWLQEMDFEKAEELDGIYQRNWKPAELQWKYRYNRLLDFVYAGLMGIAVDKKKAAIMQEEHVTGIQYLSIDKIDSHVIINPLNIENALNYEKSVVDCFDDGTIVSVDEYVFQKKEVEHAFLFQIPELNRLYATQTFKDLYERNGWTGLDFEYLCEAE